jgi:hypothetical protein
VNASRTVRILALAALFAAGCDLLPTASGPAGVPARVQVVSGDLQAGTVGAELGQPLVVRVTDARGRPAAGARVTFLAAGGTTAAGTTYTDADGVATDRWTLGTVAGDTQRVEARVTEHVSGRMVASATFHAVGRADAPAAVAPADSASFEGAAGLPVGDSLTAVVRDRYGNPVPGTAVVWTVVSGGGTISPAQSTTDAAGVARALWTLGSGADSVQVAQAAAGLTVLTRFTFHVRPRIQMVKGAGDGQAVVAGYTLPVPLKVLLAGPNGVPVQGAHVTWTTNDGTVRPAAEGVTDASGASQATWTLGDHRGIYTATATYGTTSVTFTARGTAPFLEITSPASNLSVPGTVYLHATCVGCTRMVAEVGGATYEAANRGTMVPGAMVYPYLVLDTTVGTGGTPGEAVPVAFRGFVRATEDTAVIRLVTVTTGAAPGLDRVASVPGHVEDYEPGRVLYLDTTVTPAVLKIRHGAVDSVISRPADGTPVAGWAKLSPTGALYALRRPAPRQGEMGMFELRGGAVVDLGSDAIAPPRVAGAWGTWGDGDLVYRRDFGRGTTDTPPRDDSRPSDVAANGAVAFSGSSTLLAPIFLWRGSGLAQQVGEGLDPRTDGSLVVWRKDEGLLVSVLMYTGSDTLTLSPRSLYATNYHDWRFYAVNAGYVAFLRALPDQETAELWERGPGGALTQVTPQCRYCQVLAVGPAGEVVYASHGRLFAWRPGFASVAAGDHPGDVVWRAGSAYLLEGNAVYRLIF